MASLRINGEEHELSVPDEMGDPPFGGLGAGRVKDPAHELFEAIGG